MNSYFMGDSLLRKVLLWGVAPALVALAISLVGGAKAEAYTCSYSNNGGGTFTTGSDYTGNLEYLNGNCVVMKPVEQGPRATGAGCVDQSQRRHDDGFCWTYQPEYTNLKPTYDDGGSVPQSTWEGMCGQNRHVGQQSDRTMIYNSGLHRCETDDAFMPDGCFGHDNNDIHNNLGTACTTIDDTAKNLSTEDLYKDESGARVEECTAAGATWNASLKDCNWSEQTCEAKNNNQGRWVDGKCEAYTDYTSQQECVEENGGVWLQNPNDPTHFQCQKPGTEFKDGEEEGEAEGAKSPNGIGQAVGTCGKARVNILECEAGQNEPGKVFNGILRIGVIALSMVVGAAALAGLAWSAVQYARASDDQSTLTDAKNRIKNIVIGLFLYGFIMAIANFLVPGGIV